jgi:hypothetical protein
LCRAKWRKAKVSDAQLLAFGNASGDGMTYRERESFVPRDLSH